MPITELERELVKKNACFLEDIGYRRSEDEYSVKYTLNDICISIIYPPNTEEGEINIHFLSENKVFDVGWMAFVNNNTKESEEKIFDLKELLKYIENHYFQVVDYEFCENCNYLIDKYVVEHRKKYEKSIKNFLKKN